ncbi:hypothetical protein ACSLST_06490, partial [Klebsiella pneumoniae]|uniref:hypothetical protein n=1 Tax=Klebsiella pneumoniae TaxID=573 RepID=UPI003EE052F5
KRKNKKPGLSTGLFVFAFKKNPVPKGAGFFAVWGISPPVALRLPGLQILGHLLAEGTSMPRSYRRQS